MLLARALDSTDMRLSLERLSLDLDIHYAGLHPVHRHAITRIPTDLMQSFEVNIEVHTAPFWYNSAHLARRFPG